MPKTAVIGGSGFYRMEGIKILEEKRVKTPFGDPSDNIIIAELDGKEIAFLPRHGKGHKIPPHQINFRANIWALKSLGVEQILAVSAVGSMKEEIEPGHIVIVDQFIDRTKNRPTTFFEDGITAHVSFADPVCPKLKSELVDSGRKIGATVHDGGSYVCIEGPMFSSRAESNVFRSWGVSVIGMTNYQEAKLAREAEMCFATIALSTDYDCWHESEEDVDVATVLKTVRENIEKAQRIVRDMLKKEIDLKGCSCKGALQGAIMTAPDAIGKDVKKRLGLIIGKYVG